MISKDTLKGIARIILPPFVLLSFANNFIFRTIDYTPSRYEIIKGNPAVKNIYSPKKTYLFFVNGFPSSNPGIKKHDSKIRGTIEALNKNENLESTLLSYKECKDGSDLKSKLNDELQHFSTKVTEEDSFVFVYAGHGDKKYEEAYLAFDEESLLEDSELKTLLDRIQSKNQIAIIACCYSGNIAETLKGEHRITISKGSKDHVTVNPSGEFVVDLFSNKKEADTDGNGKVSLEESFVYAAKNDWFTNYTNVFLQLPRQRPHLFSEGIDPNMVYVIYGDLK